MHSVHVKLLRIIHVNFKLRLKLAYRLYTSAYYSQDFTVFVIATYAVYFLFYLSNFSPAVSFYDILTDSFDVMNRLVSTWHIHCHWYWLWRTSVNARSFRSRVVTEKRLSPDQ